MYEEPPSTPPPSAIDFEWFVKQVQSGIELPHPAIREFTLISQPYGRFEGLEVRTNPAGLSLLIIRQTDTESTRFYLLSGDGEAILDQKLICQRYHKKNNTGGFPAYRFNPQGEVEALEVYPGMDSSLLFKPTRLLYLSPNGLIEETQINP
ncbi:MAG: hypothetical protein AAF804_15355 [Bacteroidota bacterium]